MDYSGKPKRTVTNFHPDGSEFSPKEVVLNRETAGGENALRVLQKAVSERFREKLPR